jgi:hypothetical protein
MTTPDNKVINFQRRKINEWPKEVYLADFGDGEGCRPYAYIQRPDDTTPQYVRADLARPAPTVQEAAKVLTGGDDLFIEPSQAIAKDLRQNGYLMPVSRIRFALRALAEKEAGE